MFYCTTDGQYIQEGTQFEIDGVTYPPQWLNQSTPEQKAELGLEEVVATNQPYNPVYYWTGEILDQATLTYTGIAKDLDVVKADSISSIKQQAFSILAPTDYVEARNLRNPLYKPEWITWRDEVRETASMNIGLVEACTDVDSVAALMPITWPNDPSYVVPTE